MIQGRVQGVCFRMYTRDRAEQLRLSGWVRNRNDGSVEAVFEGEEGGVQNMVDWCHAGPRLAHVTHVAVDWEEPTGTPSGFDIRRTE